MKGVQLEGAPGCNKISLHQKSPKAMFKSLVTICTHLQRIISFVPCLFYEDYRRGRSSSRNFKPTNTNSSSSNIITAPKRSLRRLCFHRCLSVHRGGLCPGGSLSGRLPRQRLPHTVKSGRYASYWNAFLFVLKFENKIWQISWRCFCAPSPLWSLQLRYPVYRPTHLIAGQSQLNKRSINSIQHRSIPELSTKHGTWCKSTYGTIYFRAIVSIRIWAIGRSVSHSYDPRSLLPICIRFLQSSHVKYKCKQDTGVNLQQI